VVWATRCFFPAELEVRGEIFGQEIRLSNAHSPLFERGSAVLLEHNIWLFANDLRLNTRSRFSTDGRKTQPFAPRRTGVCINLTVGP
jgi:hypothetical protein